MLGVSSHQGGADHNTVQGPFTLPGVAGAETKSVSARTQSSLPRGVESSPAAPPTAERGVTRDSAPEVHPRSCVHQKSHVSFPSSAAHTTQRWKQPQGP